MSQIKPELVCPAGDWPSLVAACESGADSIYFGVKGMTMRRTANNFEISELPKVMAYLRAHGKKGFLALNVIVMNDEQAKARYILEQARAAGVDAVILWDMAILGIARELGIPIHISTQASISNFSALNFYAGIGARRAVLARECTLNQIREIKALAAARQVLCGIEVFVHGAMCLSISGRCFMSLYSHGQSGNRGECTQPCRREYEITCVDGEERFIVGQDYVLSPKDLCAIDFLDQLMEAGLDAFKIEGRMRSADYVRVVTQVYRTAIDAHGEGRLDGQLKARLKEQLASVYNRGFSDGFYFGEPDASKSRGLGQAYEKIYLGEVRKYYKKIGVADVLLRTGGLKRGEEIMVIGHGTPARTAVVEEMQHNDVFVEEVAKGGHAGIRIPFKVSPKDKVFLWRRRSAAASE